MPDHAPEKPFPFLELSIELRRNIYDFVFAPEITIFCVRKAWNSQVDQMETQTTWSSQCLAPLLSTCRQVHFEAKDVAHTRTRSLVASNRMACSTILDSIPAAALRHLERIYMRHTSECIFNPPQDFLERLPNLRKFIWYSEFESRVDWTWLQHHAYSEDGDHDFSISFETSGGIAKQLLTTWRERRPYLVVEHVSLFSGEDHEIVPEGVSLGNNRIKLHVFIDVANTRLTRKTIQAENWDEDDRLWKACPVVEKVYDEQAGQR